MDEILRRLENIEKRLLALESHFGVSSMEAVPKVEPPPPPSYTPERRGAEGWPRESDKEVVKKERKNIEAYIGRWILGIVGVVAVVFGASFFLKYAFENDLIGETGRIILGVFGGVIFVVLGEWLRPRIAKYSYILSAGGLALFYLSIYAAFWFYGMISQGAAFGFMVAVTVFGVALSVWADAIILAGLSAAAGFLVPYLLSTGEPNDFSFFYYLAILNLGILAVAFFKKWHSLTLVGFVGTVLNFVSWYGAYYGKEKLFFTLYVLAIFFVIYLLAGFMANVVTRKMSDAHDLFIFTINPVWTFGWFYFLLKPQYEYSLGFVAAAFGALYIFFAYLASSFRREDTRLTLFLGAIAIIFLTVAIPLQLHQNAITIAWAAEAAVLFVLGVILKNKNMRIFSLGIFVIALIRLFAYDSMIRNVAEFVLIFNARFFTYVVTIAAAAIMGYTAYAGKEVLTAWEGGKKVLAFFALVINLLILIVITLEIYTFFEVRLIREQELFQKRQALEVAPQVPARPAPGSVDYFEYQNREYKRRVSFYSSENYRSISNQRNASISVFWTLYAVLLITFGILYRSAFLRWSALVLFGITVTKVFIIDLAALNTLYRIVSFMVLGVILLIASYLYFKNQKRIEETPTPSF